MTQKRSNTKAVLSNACLVFVGVLGSLLCVMTAFNFDFSIELYFIIAISSLTAATIYHLNKRWRIISSITVYAALIAFLFLQYKKIAAGSVIFVNIILALLKRIYPNISLLTIPDANSILLSDEELLVFFFGFIAVLVASVLAWSLIRLKSPFICLIITLPFFAASFIFVNWTPSLIAVLLYLGFLLTTFLTNNIRLGKTNTGSGVMLAIPVFTFLILLNLFNPQENYKRSDFGAKLYNFVASYFQLEAQTTNPHELSNPTENSMPSGMAPWADPNLLSLRNAKPPQGTGVVLNVRFPYEGIQYLRGASYTDYNNSSWILARDSEFSLEKLTQSSSVNVIELYLTIGGKRHPYQFIKLNFTTLLALYQKADRNAYVADSGIIINEKMDTASLDIRDSQNKLSFAFMPYYSFNNTMTNTWFTITDDYIAKFPLKQPLEYYSYRIFTPDGIGNIDSFWNKNHDVDYSIRTLYEHYNTIDRKHLTAVPAKLYDYFYNLLDSEGLLNDKNEIDKAKKIVDYVKNSAEYSINVPSTPKNEDFVQYFLETTKKGFCVHFASTATMLLRTAGIPARYVTGYVAPLGGSDSWYPVIESQAHAWTEVFIDGAGWIPIDATPGIPGLTISDQTSSNPNEESHNTSSQMATTSSTAEQSIPPATTSSPTEISETSSAGEVESFDNWFIAFIIIIPLVLVILIFVIRRRIILNRRGRLFYGADTNQAVITAWQYIKRLPPFGISPPESIHELALMAAFSNHRLTKEQGKTVVQYAAKTANQVYASLSMIKKFWFKYLKCLL